jgi:hypothetical protein
VSETVAAAHHLNPHVYNPHHHFSLAPPHQMAAAAAAHHQPQQQQQQSEINSNDLATFNYFDHLRRQRW